MKLSFILNTLSPRRNLSVTDELGVERYSTKSGIINLPRKVRVFDDDGDEVARLTCTSFRAKMYIRDTEPLLMKRKLGAFSEKYLVPELDWEILYDKTEKKHVIMCRDWRIGTVEIEQSSFSGERYTVEYDESSDELTVLTAVIAVSCFRNDDID